MRYCLFQKVLKTTHSDAFFVAQDWVFWNDGFRWIECGLFDIFQFTGTHNFPKETHKMFISALCVCSVSIVSWDEDDGIGNSCGTTFVVFRPLAWFEVKTRTILHIRK